MLITYWPGKVAPVLTAVFEIMAGTKYFNSLLICYLVSWSSFYIIKCCKNEKTFFFYHTHVFAV